MTDFDEIVNDFAARGLDIKQYQDYLRGNCPFRENHDDKSDGSNSFFLHPSKNAYHCFSCGAHGNASRLLLKIIGSSFESVMRLITQGVTAEMKKITTENDLIKVGTTSLVKFSHPPNVYISRGYKAETLKHFRIGSQILSPTLEQVEIPYFIDERRTTSVTTKTVTFKKDAHGYHRLTAKYEPELPKGTLYNLANVTGSVAILVEGESDVWRLHECKFENGIALSTSNLSQEQAYFLRMFDTIYVMMDRDWAGIKGAESVYSKLKDQNINLLFCELESEDPGKAGRRELIRSIKTAHGYLAHSMKKTLEYGSKYLDLKTKMGN